jgi:hypothetical protein
MLIRVRYATGTCDYVSHTSLDDLIRGNKITQFFRSNGWATIGLDPVRTNGTVKAYTGPERRGGSSRIFNLGLVRALLQKSFCAVLICLAFALSTFFGTALSAIFFQPVDELADPHSQSEIDTYSRKPIP